MSELDRLIRISQNIQTLIKERDNAFEAAELALKIIKIHTKAMISIANGCSDPERVAQDAINVIQVLID